MVTQVSLLSILWATETDVEHKLQTWICDLWFGAEMNWKNHSFKKYTENLN